MEVELILEESQVLEEMDTKCIEAGKKLSAFSPPVQTPTIVSP